MWVYVSFLKAVLEPTRALVSLCQVLNDMYDETSI